MSRAAAFIFLLFFAMLADGRSLLPDSLQRDLPNLKLAGEGRLRWFGLHVYDAALWVNGSRWEQDREFALHIRYARKIESSHLVGASIDEMRRMGVRDEARLARWREEMARVFPNVRKGESITGVNRPGVGAEFFHEGRPTGLVRDPEFARAFFDIWLDPRTREPGLRNSLFGAK